MRVLIVQLSDMHLTDASHSLLARAPAIADAIGAEAKGGTQAIFLVLNGDIADKGHVASFEVAKTFIATITSRIASLLSRGTNVHLLAVPGNHDCDFSEDQVARDAAITAFAPPAPLAPSVASTALSVLSAFRAFGLAITNGKCDWHGDTAFAQKHDFVLGSESLRFYLLNSAWMSRKQEKPGSLQFPVDVLSQLTQDSPALTLAVIHHPFNWFSQPTTMRPLRDRLESMATFILTGHEHMPSVYTQTSHLPVSHTFIEAGALYDRTAPNASYFNILRLDTDDALSVLKSFSLNSEGRYVQSSLRELSLEDLDSHRIDRRAALSPSFERFLDESEMPLVDDKNQRLPLNAFYVYPDLREVDTTDAAGSSRIRADQVLETIIAQPRTILTGSERSGKTSLLKQLFRDLHRTGKIPLFLTGKELTAVRNADGFRQLIRRQVQKQYMTLTPDSCEQLLSSRKVLFIDDLQEAIHGSTSLNDLLGFVDEWFGMVVVTTDEEFYYEEVHRAPSRETPLLSFRRFDICEFGHLRLAALVDKWLRLNTSSLTESVLPLLKLECRAG